MKKKLLVLLGVVVVLTIAYELLIYYDNQFRYGRMRQTPAVREHEEPLLIMEPDVVPFSGGEALYRTAQGQDLQPPFSMDDPNVIAVGKAKYFTFCNQCHGKNHDGNGTVGQSFHPLPTDLRSAPVQNKPPGLIFQSISYGIPGTRQPAMATTIRVEDRWRIVTYIKSLGLRNPPS